MREGERMWRAATGERDRPGQCPLGYCYRDGSPRHTFRCPLWTPPPADDHHPRPKGSCPPSPPTEPTPPHPPKHEKPLRWNRQQRPRSAPDPPQRAPQPHHLPPSWPQTASSSCCCPDPRRRHRTLAWRRSQPQPELCSQQCHSIHGGSSGWPWGLPSPDRSRPHRIENFSGGSRPGPATMSPPTVRGSSTPCRRCQTPLELQIAREGRPSLGWPRPISPGSACRRHQL